MNIVLKNIFTSVRLSGKKSGSYVIKEATGLGLNNVNYDCISYYNMSGQETLSKTYPSRIITITCDIIGNNKFLKKQIVDVFRKEGTLLLENDGNFKMIYYKPSVLEFGKKYGTIQPFVAQIECDNPIWEDVNEITKSIFNQKKCLSSPFTLPTVFSVKTNKTEIKNVGDEIAFPLICINLRSKGEEKCILNIINHTTGKALTIDCLLNEALTIYIDTKKRSIYTSESDNALNCLAQGVLGDFFLQVGTNNIELINNNVNTSANAEIIYKCCYNYGLI